MTWISDEPFEPEPDDPGRWERPGRYHVSIRLLGRVIDETVNAASSGDAVARVLRRSGQATIDVERVLSPEELAEGENPSDRSERAKAAESAARRDPEDGGGEYLGGRGGW